MNEAQERLLEDILSEIKKFNDNYTSELERAENERINQAIEDRNNAEILAEAEKQAIELQDQQAQSDLEKEMLEVERFESIEAFFNDTTAFFEESREFYKSSSKTIDEINNEIAREDLLEEMQQFNEQIDNAYTVVTEQGKPYIERFDYVVTAIAFILLGVLPIYFIIKWLYWQLNIFR